MADGNAENEYLKFCEGKKKFDEEELVPFFVNLGSFRALFGRSFDDIGDKEGHRNGCSQANNSQRSKRKASKNNLKIYE